MKSIVKGILTGMPIPMNLDVDVANDPVKVMVAIMDENAPPGNKPALRWCL